MGQKGKSEWGKKKKGKTYAPATKCAHGFRSTFRIASLDPGAGTTTPSSLLVGRLSAVVVFNSACNRVFGVVGRRALMFAFFLCLLCVSSIGLWMRISGSYKRKREGGKY